ncbi:MAG TPA: hypothetical protein VE153_25530 [Myxococcus sp.]|nr:hypothetical protein [Myxococcus sp.]
MENPNGNTPAPSLDLSLEQVQERILTLVAQGHGTAYQIGRLYNYVVDSGLALAGGFKDAQDFFRQRVKVLGQSVLTRDGAVARMFPEEAALKYGVSNLYTLLTYVKLAGLTVVYSEPGPTPVVVPQDDGPPVTRPFAECTVDELQRAVKHKRTPPTPLPDEDAARVQRYRDSLMRHFPEKLSIRVDARSHLGELLITLRDIPEAQMKRLAAALVDEPGTAHPVAPAQLGAHNDNAPEAPRPLAQGNTPAAPAPRAPEPRNPPLTPTQPAAHGPGQAVNGPGPVVPLGPTHPAPPFRETGLGGLLRRMTGG